MGQIPQEEMQGTERGWAGTLRSAECVAAQRKRSLGKERGQPSAQDYKTGRMREGTATEQAAEVPQTEQETDDLTLEKGRYASF